MCAGVLVEASVPMLLNCRNMYLFLIFSRYTMLVSLSVTKIFQRNQNEKDWMIITKIRGINEEYILFIFSINTLIQILLHKFNQGIQNRKKRFYIIEIALEEAKIKC